MMSKLAKSHVKCVHMSQHSGVVGGGEAMVGWIIDEVTEIDNLINQASVTYY